MWQVTLRPERCRGAVIDADALESAAKVALDGCFADAQTGRDLFVGQPQAHEVEYVSLSWCQVKRVVGEDAIVAEQ
jgi:hypothetical protein